MTHIELQRERSSAMEGAGGGDDTNGDGDDLSADPDMIRIRNIMQTEGEKDLLLLPLCVTTYRVVL